MHLLTSFDTAFQSWAQSLGMPAEGFFRLALAAVVGGLVGLERELRGRQAGFRTHLLVCLGSALLMLLSVSFASRDWRHAPGINVTVDPARMAYGVMTGIGFIGAGTILHTEHRITGLTTAAALWCVTAIGLALGFGLYSVALAAAAMVLAALWALDYVEETLPRRTMRYVTVRTPFSPGGPDALAARLDGRRTRVKLADFQRAADPAWVDVRLQVSFVKQDDFTDIERRLATEPGCHLVGVSTQ